MREGHGRMSEEDSIEVAAKRLERAVLLLEQRLSRLSGEAEAGGLFDQDRSKLASELDAARARERELVDAGQQASKALDKAIAEIRAALSEGAA
jgi:nucleoid-associated protein YejK